MSYKTKAEYWRDEWRRLLINATDEQTANRIITLAEVNGFFVDMFISENRLYRNGQND
jgi:hypothetical protein